MVRGIGSGRIGMMMAGLALGGLGLGRDVIVVRDERLDPDDILDDPAAPTPKAREAATPHRAEDKIQAAAADRRARRNARRLKHCKPA